MRKISSIVWGLVLVAAGVIFALNAFGITDINLFFDGWWTLFIIVPCTVGLFTEREKLGNIVGIVVGVLLLLCCQNVLSFAILWKLLVPAIIVIIGLKLILTGVLGNKANEMIENMKTEGRAPEENAAIFAGSKLNYDGQVFDGARLSATFGGIECDLRGAIIEHDCAIRADAVFGGIDILVPDGVNVKVVSSSIFGGVSNKTKVQEDAPTLYVSATCLFGGVEIK